MGGQMKLKAVGLAIGASILLLGCGSLQPPPGTLSDVRAAIIARDYPKAAELARKLATDSPKDPAVQFELARGEALAGNAGSAVDALNQALSLGLADAARAIKDPAFESVRADERFAAIERRLNPTATESQPASTPAPANNASAGDVSIDDSGKSSRIQAGDVVLETDF